MESIQLLQHLSYLIIFLFISKNENDMTVFTVC